MTKRLSIASALTLLAMAIGPATAAAGRDTDPTARALDQCLARKDNASTGGQTQCERAALQSYDRRLNTAYASLLRRLPPPAAQSLRASQRAWLAFHDAEAKARTALYETRQGTMYVPMEANDEVEIVRHRALELEGYVSVMTIEG